MGKKTAPTAGYGAPKKKVKSDGGVPSVAEMGQLGDAAGSIPRPRLSAGMAQLRENIQEDTYINCKVCTREGQIMGRKVPEKGVKHKCCGAGCSSDTQQKEWDDLHFLGAHLTYAEEYKKHAKCCRCIVAEDTSICKTVKCDGCGVRKHIKEYSGIVCKQFMLGQRREWKCYECQFPECCVPGCTERPPVAILHNHV
jgi:hypothetical protein